MEISHFALVNTLYKDYTEIKISEIEDGGKPMKERLEKVLKEKVDPVLESHFGGIMLTGYEDGIAYVKLTGSCSTCPSAQYTIEDVVKQIVMEEIPEVQDVILDTSVSEDLMDMARKLLNKERKGND